MNKIERRNYSDNDPEIIMKLCEDLSEVIDKQNELIDHIKALESPAEVTDEPKQQEAEGELRIAHRETLESHAEKWKEYADSVKQQELKPCPFCGKDPSVFEYVPGWCRRKCNNCGTATGWQRNPVLADKAWNRRAEPKAQEDTSMETIPDTTEIIDRLEAEIAAIKSAVVSALKGVSDYEGLPISKLNYLQGIRKTVEENAERVQAGHELQEEIVELKERIERALRRMDGYSLTYKPIVEILAPLTPKADTEEVEK